MDRDTRPNIITKGKSFNSLLPFSPQRMTVRFVNDREVHFTRRGVSGMFIMEIERFAEISQALPA